MTVHELSPEDFDRRVRSFEHWFEAVEGYLVGLENGHAPMEAEELAPDECDRLVSALSTYCVGEIAALEASSGLVRIAPNQSAQIFLATQAVDEARHVEVLLARMRELGVEDPRETVLRRAAPSIVRFRKRLLELVDEGQWDCALFAQNVMLESMEYVVFDTHAKQADPITRDLLERILRDERRHLGFGENELAASLRRDPLRRPWVESVKDELDQLATHTFEHAGRELGLADADTLQLTKAYRAAVGRLGLGD